MNAGPFVILYVEDNDLVRETFAELLATTGREVVCAADGAGAREVLRSRTVHLLMTDIHLPDVSGLELAREAIGQHPGLPVILCSGEDVREAARSLGPGAHVLRKPFELEELESLVDRLAR